MEEEREERPAEQSKSYVDTAYPHCIECEMFLFKKLYQTELKCFVSTNKKNCNKNKQRETDEIIK